MGKDADVVIIPESESPILDNPIPLSYEPDALILSDIHVPFHDGEFMSRAINLALAWGIEYLVIQGDLLDAANFSKFGTDPENTFERELSTAEGILEAVRTQFRRIVLMQGNHEMRFLGKTASNQVRVERFTRMFLPSNATNIEVTPFEWLEFETPTGIWLSAHPKNASIIAGRVPNMIAGRACTDRHVASGHGHLRALTWADDGRRYAVDTGMCMHPGKCGYVVAGRSNRPVMMQGALLIKAGIPTLVWPEVDWEAERRKHAVTIPVRSKRSKPPVPKE